jgi:hypothetical protein
MPVVNMEGVSIGFELVADGKYRAVFEGYKNGTTKGGKQRSTARFIIRAPKAMEGKTIAKTYTWDENSYWSWKRDMVAAGVDPAKLESKTLDTDKVLDALVGHEFTLSVGHHDGDDGKTYNDVEIVDEDSFGAPPRAAVAAGSK